MPGLLELERIAARGWQGTSAERWGDWLLRAGGGFTGRANSVLVLGCPGVPLPEAIDRVHAFYRSHGLPSIFQIPYAPDDLDAAPAALGTALQEQGWQAFNGTSVLVAPVPGIPADSDLSLGTVVHESAPSDRWLGGYHYRGRPLPPTAVAVLRNADQPTFVSLSDGPDLLGVARGVVTDGWLGVTAVTVAPEHRRRGVGTALMAELFRWGAARGARHAYLQVDVANTVAQAMYGRAGFREHHRYHYLQLPVEIPSPGP